MLQRCEDEWLLNLGEKVVPAEDIGLGALSQGHEAEEATDDKHVEPGETETVEEPMVLSWRDCSKREKVSEPSIPNGFNFVSFSYFGHSFYLKLDYVND